MTSPLIKYIKPGTVRYLLLESLVESASEEGFSYMQAYARARNMYARPFEVEQKLAELVEMGLFILKDGFYSLTAEGTRVYNRAAKLEEAPPKTDNLVKGNLITKLTGTYKGLELRPYNGRPGAMDAYKLPSVVTGQRVYKE